MNEHYQNRGKPETFAGRYFCYNLIYYTAIHAIEREKEIKGWTRAKKLALIRSTNPYAFFE